jgi:hypothetical protein
MAWLPIQACQAQSFSVNLAAPTRAFTGVGEGFLYGISQDGTQPSDQFMLPLGMNAFRGGGHATGGWIADGYTYGSSTQTEVNTVIAQARRITQGRYNAQYQVLLSDIFGADGGQPSNTVYPCSGGNCSNWVTFLDDVVGALQASGLHFVYDIWNEPELSIFWGGGGFDSSQYFEMWNTAVQTIRGLAPGAPIVGPDAALTPSQNPSGWSTWLSTVKAAGTLPNMITNHDEGDGDDPVTVANQINSDLAAAGISPIPLSANEYLPADAQTSGQNAYYLARFAQSGYTNATRGNWICCLTPNLAGVLTNSGGTWESNGMWWDMRAYADMTGELVSTSGEVGTTAVSAAEDSSHRRVVALLGDENGNTGAATVTFSGLSSVPWLSNNGNVEAVVYRIPDQYPLLSPQVVLDQVMSTSGGSVTVNFNFQAAHDAFAVYLEPGFASDYTSALINQTTGTCLDESNYTTVSLAQFDEQSCNGASNQTFTFTPTAAGSTVYFIHPMTPDYCVDISGGSTAGGAAALQYPCNYNSNEEFALKPVGTNTYQVVAQNSGLCIAPTSGSGANGTLIVQVSCGSPATSWTITPGSTGGGFPTGYHPLVIGNDSLCVDSYGNTSNAGAAIDQWACNGQSNQELQFVPTSGGNGELEVESSGQDVTVAGSSTSQGVPDIVQEPANGNAASEWLPEQQSDGSYQFKNDNSGLCLDVYGSGSNEGQQLDQWPCKNAPGTNQDFKP